MRSRALAAVVRASLADRLSWRADVLLGVCVGAARVALALVLWGAVFDGRPEVGGMSLGMMATYYIVAVFVIQFDQSSALSGELAAEIRMGCFGKYISRPVDPLWWFLAASCGRSAFQAASAAAAATLVGAVLALAAPAVLAPPDLLGLLAAVPVVASGLVSLALVNFMAAVLAFSFQDVSAFQVAKNSIVEFLSGALLPLALLPGAARKAIELTPFPALASLPAELILGRGFDALAGTLVRLAIWNLVLYAAARALYASLSPRYEEMGS